LLQKSPAVVVRAHVSRTIHYWCARVSARALVRVAKRARRRGSTTRAAAVAGTQFVMYAFTCCAIERWSATEMRARKSSSLRACVSVWSTNGARAAERFEARRAQRVRNFCALAPSAPVASMPKGMIWESGIWFYVC
jgi:hypothetical protein